MFIRLIFIRDVLSLADRDMRDHITPIDTQDGVVMAGGETFASHC
jgi:hypothetical protein